jgi:hypothetical protein
MVATMATRAPKRRGMSIKVPFRSLLIVPFLISRTVTSLNGDRAMIETSDGWKAMEIITEGDRLDGSSWRIPGSMDGLGAFLVDDGNTLRIEVNHELSKEAAISEINLDKGKTMQAIANMVRDNTVGGIQFVTSSDIAYDKWTRNNGESWKTNGDFCRFCSSQSYEANTFGENRGFQDRIYITGEECNDGRLFALKAATRDLYQVSGITGHVQDGSGIGGMPFDSFENAALIDTGDSQHIALLLSADGGSETLRLYVGKKNVDQYGQPQKNSNFLSRNGLLYGEWYYLGNRQSTGSHEWSGDFVTDESDAYRAERFEDIDTNPSNPHQIVLAESNSGVFIVDFSLIFSNDEGGSFFSREDSHFTMKRISDDNFGGRSPDNVDWTLNDRIFVNKDNDEGGIWYMNVNGENKRRIGTSKTGSESTGILDISNLLDFPPSTVMITTNQGEHSSMTLLLSPDLESPVLPSQNNGEGEDQEVESDCPVVTSDSKSQVFQAEEAYMLTDASVTTKEDKFCGDAYIDFGIAPNAGIEFEVDIPIAGAYHVLVRYANGGSNSRPGTFLIDNVDQNDDFVFATSNSWSAWRTEMKIVVFSDEGRYTLEIWWNSDSNRPNLDWMSVNLVDDPNR